MFDFKRFFLFLVMFLAISSCALKPLAPKKGEEEPDGNKLEKLSKVIDQGIAKATKKGKGVVNFLAGDLFLKANDSLMRGEFHLAAFLFEKLLKLVGQEPYLERKYAVSLIYTQQFQRAQRVLASLLARSGGSDLPNGLLLAGLYATLGEREKERRVYQTLLRHHPAHEEVCVLLARTDISSKRYRQAAKQLRLCERGNPSSAVFSYYLGKLALMNKKNVKALRFFERALKRKPGFDQAALEKGLIFARTKSLGKAIRFYKNHLEKHSTSYEVLKKVVQLMFASGDQDGLLEYVEALSGLESGNLNLKMRLGLLYLHAEKYGHAIGQFKEILQEVPDSDRVLYYLALIYQKKSDHHRAITHFSRISPESGFFHDSNLRMARMLQEAAGKGGDAKDVEKFLHFVQERGEKFAKLRVDMAVILSNHYESLREYTKARKAISGVRGERGYSEDHEYYLASLYEKAKDYGKAEKIVRQILEKNPDNAVALNYLGYSLLEREENLNLAYKYIKRAVELKPKDGHIRDSLGWYYYKVGRFKEALKELRRAWDLVKTDATIAKHLAQVYVALNHRRLAKRYFLEALKQCKFEWEKEEIHRAISELEPKRLPASR